MSEAWSGATARPWHCPPSFSDYFGVNIVGQPNGQRVCNTSEHHGEADDEFKARALANAALIVRAVNSHDALVKALTDLVKINEEHNEAVSNIIGRPLNWKDSYLDAARAALNIANGVG